MATMNREGLVGGAEINIHVKPVGQHISFLFDLPGDKGERPEVRMDVDGALGLIEKVAQAVDLITAEYGPIEAVENALKRIAAVAIKFGDGEQDAGEPPSDLPQITGQGANRR